MSLYADHITVSNDTRFNGDYGAQQLALLAEDKIMYDPNIKKIIFLRDGVYLKAKNQKDLILRNTILNRYSKCLKFRKFKNKNEFTSCWYLGKMTKFNGLMAKIHLYCPQISWELANDYLIAKKSSSARKIQYQWRKSINDPAYLLCRTRLLSEFDQLSEI